jgi:hypothetical protein
LNRGTVDEQAGTTAAQTTTQPAAQVETSNDTIQALTMLKQSIKEFETSRREMSNQLDEVKRQLAAQEEERKMLCDQLTALAGRVDSASAGFHSAGQRAREEVQIQIVWVPRFRGPWSAGNNEIGAFVSGAVITIGFALYSDHRHHGLCGQPQRRGCAGRSLRGRQPRVQRNSPSAAIVASQLCLVCKMASCGVHHLKIAQPRSIDEFTVPLCR